MELNKIEQLLNNYKMIKQSKVLVAENGQSKSIEVYVKLNDSEVYNTNTAAQQIRRYLAVNLPLSLLPTRIEIVTGPSKMFDENESDLYPEECSSELVEPGSNHDNIESHLIEIWRNVLNYNQIGLNDNFIDIGGDSLKATAIISQIKKRLKIEITFREFFEFPNINLLKELIQKK